MKKTIVKYSYLMDIVSYYLNDAINSKYNSTVFIISNDLYDAVVSAAVETYLNNNNLDHVFTPPTLYINDKIINFYNIDHTIKNGIHATKAYIIGTFSEKEIKFFSQSNLKEFMLSCDHDCDKINRLSLDRIDVFLTDITKK